MLDTQKVQQPIFFSRVTAPVIISADLTYCNRNLRLDMLPCSNIHALKAPLPRRVFVLQLPHAAGHAAGQIAASVLLVASSSN